MTSNPADHFQGDGDNMHTWQNYTYQQPAPSSTTPHTADQKHRLDVANLSWPAIGTSFHTPYSCPQMPVNWQAETCGLALDILQTPTQAIFSCPSSAPSTTSIASWPTQQTCFIPRTNPNFTPANIPMDYPMSIELTAYSQWPLLHQAATPQASFHHVPLNYASPARSDYSESSYSPLLVSSPYLQSDGYFQAMSPPNIKLEDSLDPSQSKMCLIPGATRYGSHSHVKPNGAFAQLAPSAVQAAPAQPGVAATERAQDEYKGVNYEECLWRTALDTERAIASSTGTSASSYVEQVEARCTKRGSTTTKNSICKCRQCGKSFRRSCNLRAHMKTHDPHREQAHACEVTGCKQRFGRRTDLARHKRSVHLKVRNFVCTMCHSRFPRKDTLHRHVEDGCPHRPEVKKRITRQRRSTTRSTPNQRYVGGLPLVKKE